MYREDPGMAGMMTCRAPGRLRGADTLVRYLYYLLFGASDSTRVGLYKAAESAVPTLTRDQLSKGTLTPQGYRVRALLLHVPESLT